MNKKNKEFSIKMTNMLFMSRMDVKEGLDRATQRLYKGCFMEQQAAGFYAYTNLGFRVLKNIENLVRKHMDNIGAQEVVLPYLQPKDLWDRSGRGAAYGKERFELVDRKDKTMFLAPTAEEAALALVEKTVSSYKQLPLSIYQISTKWRDELRPRFGLVRGREFLMKDAYSFSTPELADEVYLTYINAYIAIFNELGFNIIIVPADTGDIGGKYSHEFVILEEFGESDVYYKEFHNKKNITNVGELIEFNSSFVPPVDAHLFHKGNHIELGHTYFLGDRYSSTMNIGYNDPLGKKQPYIMGCYGIGISRIMAALAMRHRWPKNITPYAVHLISLGKEAQRIFDILTPHFSVLYDDRDKNKGCKFADAEIIGIPLWVVVGDNLEIHCENKTYAVNEDELCNEINRFYQI